MLPHPRPDRRTAPRTATDVSQAICIQVETPVDATVDKVNPEKSTFLLLQILRMRAGHTIRKRKTGWSKRSPSLHRDGLMLPGKDYWSSFSTVWGTALAWASMDVPDWTRMLALAKRVDSSATSTSRILEMAASRFSF